MPPKRKEKIPPSKVVVVENARGLPLLTPELIEQIEKFYRMGLRDSAVANMVGVSKGILSEWLMKGAAYNHGNHGELFRRCAKAVGTGEFEYVAKMREHALGAPAEFAYKFTYHPDGSVASKEVQLDGDGQPIVLKEEIRSNAVWISWFLERRFGKVWGKTDQQELGTSTPDAGFIDTSLHDKNLHDGSKKIPVHMSYDERREMFDRIKQKMEEEERAANEKDVSK